MKKMDLIIPIQLSMSKRGIALPDIIRSTAGHHRRTVAWLKEALKQERRIAIDHERRMDHAPGFSIPMPKKRTRRQFDKLVALAEGYGCHLEDTEVRGETRYELWKEIQPGIPDDHGVICVATLKEANDELLALVGGYKESQS